MEADSKEATSMASLSDKQAVIIRTERGMTILGTRVTLYDIIDHLKAP